MTPTKKPPRRPRAKKYTPTGERWQEYMPLDDLPEATRNPKDHDIDGVQTSMTRLGFIDPPVLDERTGQLVAGHGRKESLQELRDAGGDPPEGVTVAEDGTWLVPVSRGWGSKDDAEAEAAIIALNHWTEAGGWHPQVLADMLADLASGPGLDGTGYNAEDLDDLLAHLAPPDTLDNLADKYGEPDPTHLWPVLRFKVSPQARDRYLALVEGIEGGDAELFDHLLDLAELGERQPAEQ